MKDSIIIFSHNIHAFLFNEVYFASLAFKNVIIVAPENKELSSVCDRHENVQYKPMEAKWDIIEFAMSFTQLDKTIIGEAWRALVHKVVTIDYLKNLAYYLRCKLVLKRVCKSIITDQGDRWVIESAWLYATAYAICSIREVYNNATLVSLAHAFEIDDSRNRQIDFSCKAYCHDRLDYISFISENKMKEYLTNHVRKFGWREDNCHLDYLGTIKTDSVMSPPTDGRPFHIVTCSRCIKLKRLDLLIEALQKVKNLKIKWTHIGEGEEFHKLCKLAKKLPENITVSWKGRLSNEEVHAFYAENSIDAVLNLSTTEGVSISLIEALSYGIPIIATEVGGNSEICDETVGILLPSDPSPYEVRRALEKIFTMGIEEVLRIRRNAVEKYDRKFNSSVTRLNYYKKLKALSK